MFWVAETRAIIVQFESLSMRVEEPGERQNDIVISLLRPLDAAAMQR